ncbi:CsgG/HfaB family protein [Faecalibacter macacae]|uniref:Curli production assembly protein CsgG n=1 Tax=Faecalibacter macacae TaxID=1859289 RepID=A0A3L9M152_9FLAO|nr:CsgG/HfaB family protein [Faecalibacter macacae]RLZ06491.1 curli production assembly protein CsgG [Faecalibacter macacae]
MLHLNNLSRKINKLLLIFTAMILYGCNALIHTPTGSKNSTLGEITPYTSKLKQLPKPNEPVVVAVYKFKDQTGQYKASDYNSNWSTAIPQGTTSILLKALEDSQWFTTIERENIGDLLNERQIIKTTRQEYSNGQDKTLLPPLLFAGIIIEGGIISYDTNLLTGGAGLRYFGVGGSTQYRQDRLSVYLRAVSTSTGKILKTVYTSKTILSQSVNGSFFRYVDPERLLEAEVGITKNEPVHLAVKEAIENAVYSLVIEGSKDDLWKVSEENKESFNELVENQNKLDSINTTRFVDLKENLNRGRIGIFGSATGNLVKNDLLNSESKLGINFGLKFLISDFWNVSATASTFELANKKIFNKSYNSLDLDVEYLLFPQSKFTPFGNIGIGIISPSEGENKEISGKVHAGGGFEYMLSKKLGIRAFGRYDFGFSDDWENVIAGKRNDNMIVFGAGLNLYFGNRKNK